MIPDPGPRASARHDLLADAGVSGFGGHHTGSGDTIFDSDACPWVRVSGVSRSGPGSVPGMPRRPRYRTGGRYARGRGALSIPLPDSRRPAGGASWGQLEQRSNPHQPIVATTQVHHGAAPAISAWCIDQARADRIEFDVPHGGQQIGFIERERGEAPLPEMPAPALAEVGPSRVPAMRPADGLVQTACRLGHHDQC
jgi:hypothetical protein